MKGLWLSAIRSSRARRGLPAWGLGAVLCWGAAGCGDEADPTYITRWGEVETLRSQPSTTAVQTPIVFRSDRAEPGVGDLYVMAPDGSNVRRLTEGGDFTAPVWSPDGRSIAYRQLRGAEGSVGLLALEGGERVQLVTGLDPSLWSLALSWSPDGRDLLYADSSAGALSELWAVSRFGGQPRRLLPEADGALEVADASPVDSRIVYRWKRDVVPGEQHGRGTTDLWLADDPEDPEPENLTQGRVYAPHEPRWSPDGTRIAFSGYAMAADGSVEGFGAHGGESTDVPDAEIFVLDVVTRDIHQLTNDDQDDLTPVWTADGGSLLFASGRDHVDMDIWRVPLDAPDQAVNLTDVLDNPGEELMPDYFRGALPSE